MYHKKRDKAEFYRNQNFTMPSSRSRPLKIITEEENGILGFSISSHGQDSVGRGYSYVPGCRGQAAPSLAEALTEPGCPLGWQEDAQLPSASWKSVGRVC